MSYNCNMKKFLIYILLLISLFLWGCGRKKESSSVPEIIDPGNGITYSAGEYSGIGVSDGAAMNNFADEEYNSLSKADSSVISALKDTLASAADACREIYLNADKGGGVNVSLGSSDVYKMVTACGQAGITARDYLGDYSMSCWEALDEFGKSTYISEANVSGSYVDIYSDGHMSAFTLSRESGVWHLYGVSGDWEEDGSFRTFSEGRYSVGGVTYTEKGWLIYTRNTSDFDENQKKNTDSYTMLRVVPRDETCSALCARYVEPIGYLENNLFITDWSNANLGPIDFNSLYAYLFAMYNGTDMLSSYNVRNYYRAYNNTRLYVVPTDTFETVVRTWFSIDPSTLKAISDFSYSAGGYFFLGYNRDYYNVSPRTPEPEVVDYSYNSDGSVTMTVDAVNSWYGTDCAFRHILTVMPTKNGFMYVSNDLIEDENNILPQQLLSEMLDVEKTKLD